MAKSKLSGYGSIIGIFLVFVIICFLIDGYQYVNKLFGGGDVEEKTTPNIVVDGQNGFLIQDTFVALDKESYNELFSYIKANNTSAIMRMTESSRVFKGNIGEAVTMIDSGIAHSLIEIISTGQRGFVPSEMVRSRLE
jgi:hypothetical protein